MITATVPVMMLAPQPIFTIGPTMNWPSVGGKIVPMSLMIWRARGTGSTGNSIEPSAPRRMPSCRPGTFIDRLMPTIPADAVEREAVAELDRRELRADQHDQRVALATIGPSWC